jgi:hypothetical protein
VPRAVLAPDAWKERARGRRVSRTRGAGMLAPAHGGIAIIE